MIFGHCVRSTKERWISNKTRGCGNQLNSNRLLEILYYQGGDKHMLGSLNMVHFHLRLSLRAHGLQICVPSLYDMAFG